VKPLLVQCPGAQTCSGGLLIDVCSGHNRRQHAEGLDAVKFDDNEDIKKLPKYDNFGSLSDLGSLFSGGAPRSLDVRAAGGRQPPSANLSITSPHPVIKNAANAGVELKDGVVPAVVPSPAT
jgi:hypothetical protein